MTRSILPPITVLVAAGALAICCWESGTKLLGFKNPLPSTADLGSPAEISENSVFPRDCSKVLTSRDPGFVDKPAQVLAGALPAGSSPVAGADSPPRVEITGPATAGKGSILSRAWDPDWLQSFAGRAAPRPVRFELPGGDTAEGEMKLIEENDGHIVLVAGRLSKPEPGKFFFQRQSLPGVAGSHVGVVELSGSRRAFRLEPSPRDGSPELVSRRLDEIACLGYPQGDRRARPVAHRSPEPMRAPLVDVGQHPDLPTPDYQNEVPVLDSLPGAPGVIYLDFDGETTNQWFGMPIVAARPDFTPGEIREIWERVSEDFISFNINLTTDLKVFERAAENSRIRVIITPTMDASPGNGGVAMLGSWNWTGDFPAWVFGTTVNTVAGTISHEAGHALGLSHDGRLDQEYYEGHGTDEMAWAPIMGAGWERPVGQWSRGEYADASNQEDDLKIISATNNSVNYRPDDHGESFDAATYLEIFGEGAFMNRGIIEQNTDADAFRFTTLGGRLNLSASPAVRSPNLAIGLELTDVAGQVVLSSSPATTLRASLTTDLPAGEYAVKVRGAGRGADANSGFTAYGSLGYYQLAGTVEQGVEPIRFSVTENAPNGLLVGDLNPFATGPGPRVFRATGGNGDGPLALSADGQLTVAVSGLLDFEENEHFTLFVDIEHPDNPVLNESNRRVVIMVVDENEEPLFFDVPPLRVYDRTLAGTTVGSISATDPDTYTRLSFDIAEGNQDGWFDINDSGELSLIRDLNTGPTTINLRLEARDTGSPPQTSSIQVLVEVLSPPPGLRPGTIAYARYEGIPGGALEDLTSHPRFPGSPSSVKQLARAEIPFDKAQSIGGAIRAYLLPPVTGSYTFAIAARYASELRLSTTDRPEESTRIAYSATPTGEREWTRNPTQRSLPIELEAGRAYYLEALVKERLGAQHLSVAWSSAAAAIPKLQVIPGRFLASVDSNFAPLVSERSFMVHRNAFAGGRIASVIAVDADGDLPLVYEIISSTIPGILAVDPDTGWIRVADSELLATTPDSTCSLTIRVTDSDGNSGTGQFTSSLLGISELAATEPVAEIFNDIGDATEVSALTDHVRFPGAPDELRPLAGNPAAPRVRQLRLSSDSGDDYGSRIRAEFVAPRTGSFRFAIASDEASELWLGTTSDSNSARVVARVTGAVGSESWNEEDLQQSAAISLVANRRYYLETRHKEGAGPDHLEVGSTLDSASPEVMSLSDLRPVDLGYPPEVEDASATIWSSAPARTPVADFHAFDSPLEFHVWRIAGGNEEGIFAIEPDEGLVYLKDSNALIASARNAWQLSIEVQNSGFNDQYTRKTSALQLDITRSETASSFDAWAVANGIPGAQPGNDDDGDGAGALMEFAFGGNPMAADFGSLVMGIALVPDGEERRVQLTFRRRLDAASAGLTYLPKASVNLGSEEWTPAPVWSETTSTDPEDLPEGYEVVSILLAETVPVPAGIRFYRIEVTMQVGPR